MAATGDLGAVTGRFWEAYRELLALGRTGVNRFCREIGADKRNFLRIAGDPARLHIRADWLSVLVSVYGVSAGWLLTGEGWIFGE